MIIKNIAVTCLTLAHKKAYPAFYWHLLFILLTISASIHLHFKRIIHAANLSLWILHSNLLLSCYGRWRFYLTLEIIGKIKFTPESQNIRKKEDLRILWRNLGCDNQFLFPPKNRVEMGAVQLKGCNVSFNFFASSPKTVGFKVTIKGIHTLYL